eukprot:gene50150-67154_t
MAHVAAHPNFLPCDRKLEVGVTVMGRTLFLDTSSTVVVTRGSTVLNDGDSYTPGEVLGISLSLNPANPTAEWIFETSTGVFNPAQSNTYLCPNQNIYTGKRSKCTSSADYRLSPTLTAPTDNSDVIIVAAWSPGYGQARLSNTISLKATTSKPSTTPSRSPPKLSQTRKPTGIPSVRTPTKKPSTLPTLDPTKKPTKTPSA